MCMPSAAANSSTPPVPVPVECVVCSDSTLRLWDKHTGEYDVLDVFVVCAVYACVCVCVCVCCVVFVVCA